MVSAVGMAAGASYVALPPARATRRTPLVVAWHGPQASDGERGLSAALPLRRLPAWRVYLQLPGSGVRAPAVNPNQELPLQLATPRLVPATFGPVAEQAAADLPAVVAALRTRLPGADGPVGLLGWSVGATVVLQALAERRLPVHAVALVRPLVQLARLPKVDPRRRRLPSRCAGAVVERLDFLAMAAEIAEQGPQPAVLVASGVREDPAIGEPAERLWRALTDRYQVPSRVALLLAPELASELAPQPADLRRVDAAVTDWFVCHLTELTGPGGTTMD